MTTKNISDTYAVYRYAADGHGGEPGDGAIVYTGSLEACRDYIASLIVDQTLEESRWSGIDEDIEAYHEYPADHPEGEGCGGWAIRSVESIAQQIAKNFPDGTTFETSDGQPLDDLCQQHAVKIEIDTKKELTRYVFRDGSAIVEGVGAWDIEGLTPFSWAGA